MNTGETFKTLEGDPLPTTRNDGDSNLPVGTKLYKFKYDPSEGAFIVELDGEYVNAVNIR